MNHGSRGVTFQNQTFFETVFWTRVIQNSAPIVTNCTFSGNLSKLGGGMYNERSGSPKVTNCIFWADKIYGEYGSNPTFSHSNIQNSGGSGDYWDLALGIDAGGNIDNDPCFVDIAHQAGADGIWRTVDDGLALKTGSPCIDAGRATGAPATDILGNRRVGAPDVGAYEYISRSGVAIWAFYK